MFGTFWPKTHSWQYLCMRLQGVGLMVSKKIFQKVFHHFKSIEANDSMAIIDTRSKDGRIYVGDHKA